MVCSNTDYCESRPTAEVCCVGHCFGLEMESNVCFKNQCNIIIVYLFLLFLAVFNEHHFPQVTG